MRTKTGILKTGSVRGQNFHERWTAEQMDVLEGTPWKLNPEADDAEAVLPNLDEQNCMPAEVVTERPRYLEREIVPRRVMITVFVVGQFGPSPSCMGCHFLCVGGN